MGAHLHTLGAGSQMELMMLGSVAEKVNARRGNKLAEFLDLRHFSGDKSHENSLRRRVTVNPILRIISILSARPDFSIRIPQRRNHRVFIHSDYCMVILDSLF